MGDTLTAEEAYAELLQSALRPFVQSAFSVKEWAENHPEHPGFQLLHAMELAYDRQFGEAGMLASRWAKEVQDDADNLSIASATLTMCGHFQPARTLADRALNLAPNEFRPLASYLSLAMLDRSASVERVAQRCLELHSGDPQLIDALKEAADAQGHRHLSQQCTDLLLTRHRESIESSVFLRCRRSVGTISLKPSNTIVTQFRNARVQHTYGPALVCASIDLEELMMPGSPTKWPL
jgi:hypothetical protein